MKRVEFNGKRYETVRQAASAWAWPLLPLAIVIGQGEDAETLATEFEGLYWEQIGWIGCGAPEGVLENEWRAECRIALKRRILQLRGQSEAN